MNGTFSFVYSGERGLGMGIFKVKDSVLVGADFGGIRYKGTATEDLATGEIDLSFDMAIPPGTALVQSTSAQDIPYTKTGAGRVPPEFNRGKPFEIFIAPGQVTMMVHQIPDENAVFADGFTINLQAQSPNF